MTDTMKLVLVAIYDIVIIYFGIWLILRSSWWWSPFIVIALSLLVQTPKWVPVETEEKG